MTAEEKKVPRRLFSIGAVLLLALALFSGSLLATSLFAWFKEREASVSERSARTVVLAVRRLARLETAQLRLQQVIDLRDKQERFWGLLESEDAVLLIASGDVTAGVDLGDLGQGQVTVDADRLGVRVELPQAKIFTVALDSEHTFVHTRSTGLLAKRNDQLEGQARTRAEHLFRQNALDAQILDRASRNAEQTLRALLESLGFERVSITGGGRT